MLTCVSLTGPDDQTDITELQALAVKYPFVEWALLYVPHNEGAARNPRQAWRKTFFEVNMPGTSAVHLCGSQAFNELQKDMLPAEILQADRLQLNINARRKDFTDKEVLEIYKRSLDLGPDIILQRHADTAALIDRFIAGLPVIDTHRIHVLLDESKGTGSTPDVWRRPDSLDGIACGYAGGIGPHNVQQILPLVAAIHQPDEPYWIDMESGVRTDNQFDIFKAEAVLAATDKFLKR